MARSKRPRRSTPPTRSSRLARRLRVFCSYAHADEGLLKALHNHLATLRRVYGLSIWYDREILPGDDFSDEIDRHLATSDIVLLLISPDFLASDYCYCREMRRAINRHAAGRSRVVPIILRHCDWKATPLNRIQALPKDGKPVNTWHRRDEALLDVVKGVRRAVEELLAGTA